MSPSRKFGSLARPNQAKKRKAVQVVRTFEPDFSIISRQNFLNGDILKVSLVKPVAYLSESYTLSSMLQKGGFVQNNIKARVFSRISLSMSTFPT